jgi:acyl-CoA reductase-like NAD-dependent aldehyde dehydrogenase
MAKKRSKKKGGTARKLGVTAVALALMLCGASAAVGVMNWFTRACGDDITDNLRIEVLNGTGERGVGRMVARALMKKRVDVLFVDNARR